MEDQKEEENGKFSSEEPSPVSICRPKIGTQKFVFVKKQKETAPKKKRSWVIKKRKKYQNGDKENDQSHTAQLKSSRSIVETSAIYESNWVERAIKPNHTYLYWNYHMNECETESEAENEEDTRTAADDDTRNHENIAAYAPLSTLVFIDKHIVWSKNVELTNPWLLSTMKNYCSTSVWGDTKSKSPTQRGLLKKPTASSVKTRAEGKAEGEMHNLTGVEIQGHNQQNLGELRQDYPLGNTEGSPTPGQYKKLLSKQGKENPRITKGNSSSDGRKSPGIFCQTTGPTENHKGRGRTLWEIALMGAQVGNVTQELGKELKQNDHGTVSDDEFGKELDQNVFGSKGELVEDHKEQFQFDDSDMNEELAISSILRSDMATDLQLEFEPDQSMTELESKLKYL